MIYTYQKRKELNKLFREAYPSYSYTEDKEGVPRMRMDRLPATAEPVGNLHTLELMAYRYWEEHRQPMPDLHYKGRESPEESEGQIFSPIYFYLPFVLLIFAVHFSEPIPLRVIHQRPQGTG